MSMMGMEVLTKSQGDQSTGFEVLGGAPADGFSRPAGLPSAATGGVQPRPVAAPAANDPFHAVDAMSESRNFGLEQREAFRGGYRLEQERVAEAQSELSLAPDEGRGAGVAGDRFDLIVESAFVRVTDAPLLTFPIDVDSASYAKVRMYLNEQHQLPRPDAVRIEELINYFPYDYAGPDADGDREADPFAAHQDVVTCPWNPDHRLVRIGLKGREVENHARPRSNLVFLLDVSGSMDEPNKLPLLKRGLKMLADELTENDRVAIVVYAGAAGMVLDSTTGDKKATVVGALSRLNAGGSTNGGAGIQLAYQTALDNFIEGGVNRVILCTDGDFNVGTTGTDQLVRLFERNAKAGVFISVLGFGMGNHNDSMLEQISNKGNGNYAFVDTDAGAPVDALKYQAPLRLTEDARSRELLTLKLRYKQPDGEVSRLLTFPLIDSAKSFHESDRDLQFAAAVASFGMLLRNSQHSGNASFASVLELAGPAAKHDDSGYRQEFLQLVRRAASLRGE